MHTTVTKEQIEERVLQALVEFGADPGRLSREAELEPLDIDSLDLVELAQIVEDEYGVRLTGEDMEPVKTVGDAIDLVASRLS
jgi:acyl carrier protein